MANLEEFLKERGIHEDKIRELVDDKVRFAHLVCLCDSCLVLSTYQETRPGIKVMIAYIPAFKYPNTNIFRHCHVCMDFLPDAQFFQILPRTHNKNNSFIFNDDVR